MEDKEKRDVRYHNLKNKCIYVVCFAAMLGVLGTVYYACFFREIHMDLTHNVEVSFVGENGSGHIEIERHDLNYNQRIQPFYDSLSTSFSSDGTLTNGDEVTVTIMYDNALAEKFNIVIDENTMLRTVEGLAQRFSSKDEITADFLRRVTEKCERYMKSHMDYILGQDFNFASDAALIDQRMLQRVFLKANDMQIHDKIIDIYQMKAEGKKEDGSVYQETIYYMLVFDDINSNMQLSDHQIYGEKALYTEENLGEETGIICYFRNKYILSYDVILL